jgi:hypothetical protein
MTTPNAELAYRVLDHIDAHPELWSQGLWWSSAECGTAGCFAGWAVKLSGGDMTTLPAGLTPSVTAGLGDLNGELVPYAAAHLLGIPGLATEDFADDLFSGDNTREDLGEIVEKLFGPRPVAVAR